MLVRKFIKKNLPVITNHSFNLFSTIQPKIVEGADNQFDQSRLFQNNPRLSAQACIEKFPSLKGLNIKHDENKLARLSRLNHASSTLLKERNPDLLAFNCPGIIVYRLSSISPEELIKAGGFENLKLDFYWHKFLGCQEGSINFCLLPEIPAIFAEHLLPSKKAFLYAVPLTSSVKTFLSGGKLRQIISPGAFPLPKTWFVREIKKLEHRDVLLEHRDVLLEHRDVLFEYRDVLFGPMQGELGNLSIIAGERFEDFCNGTLKLPQKIDYGSDYPLEWEIQHTENTFIIEELIKDCYEKNPVPRKNSP